MAVTYGFFNSVNGDRKYNAEQMSEYFRGIVNEGVFQHLDGGLAVTAGTGLAVSVASGRAIIQNRWVQNSDAMTLSISAASETYARKDAVVIRLNWSSRAISIAVKTGTPAASPVAPSMTRNSTTYEMALAYVNVAANATSVTVTDKRSDSTVCGWVTVAQSTSGEVDAQLNAMKTGFDGVVYNSPAAMVQGCDQKLQDQIDQTKGSLNLIDETLQPVTKDNSIGTITGALKTDGTIAANLPNIKNNKYSIPSGTTTIYVSGYNSFDGGSIYSLIWFVSNNTMIGQVPKVKSGKETFIMTPFTVPEGTEEVWMPVAMSLEKNGSEKLQNTLDSLDNYTKAYPYEQTKGIMTSNGNIETWFNATILKYRVPEGATQFYMIGTGTYSQGASPEWCYAQFRDNSSMLGYISPSTNPQTFTKNNIYTLPEGTTEVWIGPQTAFGNNIYFLNSGILKVAERLDDLQDQIDNIAPIEVLNQWNGKTWYCYGTSISNTSAEGKYPTYLAQMSGMVHVNKGISGGGIGDLGGYSHGQVYDAICNITDGKLNADLITLETGANDTGADVPLGTIYDTGRTTLAGCLNDCLRYLQANTNAQIAVMVSPATTTLPAAAGKYYEWAQMVQQICYLNRVHFINSNNNMGYGKISSNNGSSYVVDNIHQTNLGGYIMAQNIWYQLRNIPLFYTAIPT